VRWACRGLTIPSAIDPGKPSRPDPSGQGHSSVGRSTLTAGIWPAPLAGGSMADGMISKDTCWRHRRRKPTRSPCHWCAINHGQKRRMQATTGYTSWQVRRDDCLFRSDSQADSAGSIPVARPVTRSARKPKVSGYAEHGSLSRSRPVDLYGQLADHKLT